MQNIKIGSLVKSLDFHSQRDCYYVGIVRSIDEDRGTFTADTVARYWGHEPSRGTVPETFTAPLEGNHWFDDPSRPRVIVLDVAAA